MSHVAIIGGTGVEHLTLEASTPNEMITPYGEAYYSTGLLDGSPVVFLKRHGKGHAIPPHRINYRANIWALHQLGIKKIIATGAVGSLVSDYRLGDFVLVDQFIDFTKARIQTFYEGGEQGVLHVDLTEPYCRDLQRSISEAAKELGIDLKSKATYICTEGPRFETPAEIKMFKQWGAHLVGMTSVPEVILARELGMCYATIALVTNEAAGISQHPLTHEEVIVTMKSLGQTIADLFKQLIPLLTPEQHCRCHLGNAEAGKF